MLSDEQTPEGVYLQLAPSAKKSLDLIQLPDQDILESHVVLFLTSTKVIMSHLWPLVVCASEDVHFMRKLMMHVYSKHVMSNFFLLVIVTSATNETKHWELNTGSCLR